jgi:hypothetical protein
LPTPILEIAKDIFEAQPNNALDIEVVLSNIF